MRFAACALASCLIFGAAHSETIYKYRQPDGRTLYSNRLLPDAELIETFEYRFPAPAGTSADAARRAALDEERIRKHLAALQAAWDEVLEARTGLAKAEARLSAGVEPLPDEGRSLAGPVAPAAAGGPMSPAAAAAGGPSGASPAAVGGPKGTRRGGGRQREYDDRMQALENEAQRARARLEAALRGYNELR